MSTCRAALGHWMGMLHGCGHDPGAGVHAAACVCEWSLRTRIYHAAWHADRARIENARGIEAGTQRRRAP